MQLENFDDKIKRMKFRGTSINTKSASEKRAIKEKILLLLMGGYLLGFSRTPKNYFRIAKNIAKEWKDIERKRLFELVREFHHDRLVDFKEDENGIAHIVLTKDGKQKALEYQIDEMKIKKPAKWDKKWRIVIFDIPERKKKAREALRSKLQELGFLELQKSVLIYPYECENEIDFIVEVFQIRQYVRFLRTDTFTNEEQFRLKFELW